MTKLAPRSNVAITKTQEDRLVDAIGRGLSVRDACALAEVNVSAYYRWVRWGEEGRMEYKRFFNRIRHAHATLVAKPIDTLVKAAENGDVHAAKFLASKLRPKQFGDNPDPEDPIAVAFGEMTDVEMVDHFLSNPEVRGLFLERLRALESGE